MRASKATRLPPIHRRSRLFRVLKGLAVGLSVVLLLVAGLTIWLFRSGRATPLIREALIEELRTQCDLDAEIGGFAVDALALRLRFSDLKLHQRRDGSSILAVDAAEISARGLPLLYGRLQLRRVLLNGPSAALSFVDGQLQDLPPCLHSSEGEDGAGGLSFGVDEVELRDGQLRLQVDELHAVLRSIGLTVRHGGGGGARVELGFQDAIITHQRRARWVDALSLRGHLEGPVSDPRAFVVDALEAKGEGIQLKLTGSIDRLGPVYSAEAELEAPAEALSRVLPGAPPMRGRVSLSAAVSGSRGDPRGVGQVRLRKVWVEDFYLGDDTRVKFSADTRGVAIPSIKLRLGEGSAKARGRINFDKQLSLRATVDFHKLSLGALLSALTVEHSWADLKMSGRTSVQGRLRGFELAGPFDLRSDGLTVTDGGFDLPRYRGRAPGAIPPEDLFLHIPRIKLAGRWRFDSDGIDFKQARVSSAQIKALMDARVGFSMSEGLRVKAQFSPLALQDLGPIAGLRLAGLGPASLSVRGAYDELSADGRLALRGVKTADIPWGSASAQLAWRDLVDLQLSGIRGHLGASRYEAEVGVRLEGDAPLSIRGEVKPGRLEDLLIPLKMRAEDWGDLKGAVDARFELDGPVDLLSGPVEAKIGEAEIFGERAEGGTLGGRMERGTLMVEDLRLKKGGGVLVGAGALNLNDDTIWVHARSQRMRLQDLDLIKSTQPRLDGGLRAALSVKGDLDKVTGSLKLKLKRAKAGEISLGSGDLDGLVDGRKLSFKGGLSGIGLRVDGWLRLGEGLEYYSKVWLEDTDLPGILLALQGGSGWHGAVTLGARLRGSLVDWQHSSGELDLAAARVDSELLSMRTAAPTTLGLSDGVFQTSGLSLIGPLMRATVRGEGGVDRLDLNTSGSFDLGLAERLLPPVEKAEGRLRFQGVIGGSPEAVNLLGTGRVEGRVLKWAGFEDRVTGFSGDLVFSQSSVWIRGGLGRWAGGELKLSGSVLLEGFYPHSLSLRLGLKGARPRFTTQLADLSGRVSGRLNIDGPLEELSVRGRADIRQGRVRPRTDIQSLMGSSSIVQVYDPEREVVDMDIKLRLLDKVRVQNADVDLEMGGELRLTGSNERFGMLGNLSLVQGGQAVFFAREYVVQSGAISFRDRFRIDPRFDVVLSAEACDARIRVNLAGDLDNVQTNYSSAPQMDQRDVVSCLLQGVKVTQVGDQGLSSLAGSALLKLSGVDQQVRRVLLIDQIDVTSQYSTVEHAYEPRVVVAKNLRLLSRSARLEYSSSLLSTTDQSAAFRVRLLPRLTLQLGWTSSTSIPYGDWGLDLKQRWEW